SLAQPRSRLQTRPGGDPRGSSRKKPRCRRRVYDREERLRARSAERRGDAYRRSRLLRALWWEFSERGPESSARAPAPRGVGMSELFASRSNVERSGSLGRRTWEFSRDFGMLAP